MRAMYPKSPAKRRWGIHRANILPPKGLFAVRSSQIMHGARILPPFDESGPCAGMTSHTGRVHGPFSTPGPCARRLTPRAPPIPVTRRTPPLLTNAMKTQIAKNDFGQQAIDPSRKSRMEAVKNRMRERRIEPCRREQRSSIAQHRLQCSYSRSHALEPASISRPSPWSSSLSLGMVGITASIKTARKTATAASTIHTTGFWTKKALSPITE